MKIAEERGVGSEEYESVMNNNLHGQTAVVASKNDTLFTPKYHSKTSCVVYTNVVNCVNDCTVIDVRNNDVVYTKIEIIPK